MATLEDLTKRINVLVKTNNRLALEFQKAIANSKDERHAVERMIYRISRDVDEVTDEIVADEEYYGTRRAREAVKESEAAALLQIEREREEAHNRIIELQEATAKQIAQQKEIASRESEALKREVEAFKESAKTFEAATESQIREVAAITQAVEDKIVLLNDSFKKSSRVRNWIIATLSILMPGVYFLGDLIDLLG